MGWMDDLGPAGGVVGSALAQGKSIPGVVGDYANGAADFWKKRGPHAYSTPGYNIDPNAFINGQAGTNRAAWANAAANPRSSALADLLMGQANGTAPSLAESFLRSATDRNIAGGNALQASARGVNPALAARMAQQGAGQANREAAGQATQARLAEMASARGQLGDVLNSQQQNQQYYSGLENSQDLAQLNAQIAGQQLGVQNTLGAAGINAGAQTANNQLGAQYLGAGLNALGSIGGAAATGLAHGGEVPMPDSAADAMMASMGSSPMMHYDNGGQIPGVDHGQDETLIAARPTEIVVNPESAAYPMAKSVVEREHMHPDLQNEQDLVDMLMGQSKPAQAGPGMMAPAPAPAAPQMTLGRRLLRWLESSATRFHDQQVSGGYAPGVGGMVGAGG